MSVSEMGLWVGIPASIVTVLSFGLTILWRRKDAGNPGKHRGKPSAVVRGTKAGGKITAISNTGTAHVVKSNAKGGGIKAKGPDGAYVDRSRSSGDVEATS